MRCNNGYCAVGEYSNALILFTSKKGLLMKLTYLFLAALALGTSAMYAADSTAAAPAPRRSHGADLSTRITARTLTARRTQPIR